MSWSTRSLVAFAAVFALAGPVAAQQLASVDGAADRSVSQATSPLFAGPTATAALLYPAPPAVDVQLESALSAAAQQRARSSSSTLMIIGGATMVVGALVGGDAGTIIMIGGGGIALVGLWRYLQ